MEIVIQHDKENRRFFADVSGEISDLKYKKIDAKTLDYYSTFVPESLRNQGIAGKITKQALDYALSNNYNVIPSCPFVKKYMKEHSQYERLNSRIT